ncbi:hypothetical protein OG21DRAFT_384824 [Imleria badia]|nr:hypothetical protein OG21DRAFT_384824 [Imleria badia]
MYTSTFGNPLIRVPSQALRENSDLEHVAQKKVVTANTDSAPITEPRSMDNIENVGGSVDPRLAGA